MKILVCIKQVPPMEEILELDTKKKWLSDSNVAYRLNRFDEFAIEEAILIKESIKNTIVDVISVGPERVQTALRRAMGMGADNAVHIEYGREGFVAPLIIASFIAKYVGDKEYDLILTGIMSEDAMQSVVGPSISSKLNIPCATSVIETDIKKGSDKIIVSCELEGARHQEIELKLPALLTIQSGINKPRYPSLSNILRANKQNILKIEGNFDISPFDDELDSLDLPEKSNCIKFLEGTVQEKAEKLIKILKKKSVLKV